MKGNIALSRFALTYKKFFYLISRSSSNIVFKAATSGEQVSNGMLFRNLNFVLFFCFSEKLFLRFFKPF